MTTGDEPQIAQRLAVQQAASRILLESGSLDEAMADVLRLLSTQLGWSMAVYWVADEVLGAPTLLRCRAIWAEDRVLRAPVVEATRTATLARGEDPPGRAMASREPVWIEQLTDEGASPRLRLALAAGLHAVAAFPLREREAVPAVIELYSSDPRASDDGTLHLITGIGHQVGLLRRRIEAQTAALETLEQAREDLETVLRALPDTVAVRDSAGRILYANDPPPPGSGGAPVAELLRGSAAELAGRFELWDHVGQPLAADDLPGARAARGQVEDRQIRVRQVGSGEGDHWIAVKATPLAAVPGAGRRVVLSLREVTAERRDREWRAFLSDAAVVLASATELGPMLDDLAALASRTVAAGCAIVLQRPTGDLQPAALARAGLSVAAQDAAAGEQVRAARAALEAGKSQVSSDGVLAAPLAVRGRRLGALVLEARPDGGYGPADLAYAQDLAGRCALAIENIRLLTDGLDSLRARDDLMAIVSHDLRNPLGVVMASSALLLKSPLNDPPGKEGRSRRQVEAIQRAGNRMNRLIRDLLDFAAIQAGRLSISSHPRGAGELVLEVFTALAAPAAAKSLKLVDGNPESTLRVSCDHDRAIQLLDNVVGNAVKFSNEGGTVTVQAEPDGDMIRFSVTDEGPGIPEDEVAHVFDRAYQAKRRNRDGIGIGLSIARGIVEAHGGRIWVQSPVAPGGGGTTFFFTLPAAQQ